MIIMMMMMTTALVIIPLQCYEVVTSAAMAPVSQVKLMENGRETFQFVN